MKHIYKKKNQKFKINLIEKLNKKYYETNKK